MFVRTTKARLQRFDTCPVLSAAISSLRPTRYHAFLSYNSQDRSAVQEVARRLKGDGLSLYLEEWELLPGREFQPALAEALHESKTCVVFLGPNGLGPWQKNSANRSSSIILR